MRWIKFLRALLGFVYFFAAFSAILSPFYFFIAGDGFETKFNLGGTVVPNLNWVFYLVLGLTIISQFLFVIMLYNMKKAAWLLKPSSIVSLSIANHFYKAGIFCVAGALLNRIPVFIYKYVNIKEFAAYDISSSAVNMGFSFDSMLVIISFGIFLVVTSKIIKMSIIIKEENDLTI